MFMVYIFKSLCILLTNITFFSTTDWPMSCRDHMDALSVKVPVSSSVSPACGHAGDVLDSCTDPRGLLSSSTGGAVAAASFGVDDSDMSFHPLLGQDSLMSERDSQADPDAEASDTPHSFELCSPRGPSDCTSSSFDIVFEDSGCDRDAEADTDSVTSRGGGVSPGAVTEKNTLSSSHTRKQESAPPSSSTLNRPTSLALGLPTNPPTQRVQPSPKVRFSTQQT